MILNNIDIVIILLFFVLVIIIGYLASKKAGKSTSEFFLGGRNMPWWMLGVSMVATTFSADTPNLVTGMVREGGVSKNWAWWAFLITGMVTVFIYAKLWRRSKVLTDLEFYELRYGGKRASFLRIFRSLYLGIFFNCLIIGSVTLAAIKISAIMFGLLPIETVVISSTVIVLYTTMGGIKSVIWTDLFQFGIALIGSVYAAYVAVNHPDVGGLQALLTHPNVVDKISFLPDFNDTSLLVSLFIIPIAVQWWSVWYPGAEPGGGGYIAQKMLSAKGEKHAVGATLFFNFAHYALRPWPWILVALSSIVLFPDLNSIKENFPHITKQYLGHDIAYPVMMTLLSPGWLGLVVAGLIAAFMSTVATHLNWGASYFVNDFYKRVMRPNSSEKELVTIGRIAIVVLMIIASCFSLFLLENATQAFNILILSGAGSGSIFLLRWFWWRINALTEIVAMVFGTVLACVLVLGFSDAELANQYIDGNAMKLLIATTLTTIVWVLTTLFTKPEKHEVLIKFYSLTRPGGLGWKKVLDYAKLKGDYKEDENEKSRIPQSMVCVLLGCIAIYSGLFAIGSFVYGDFIGGVKLILVFAITTFAIFKFWNYLGINKVND